MDLEFYKCRVSNQDSQSLKDVWNFTEQQYEAEHGFIQWVFPSDEPSMVNSFAPVVDQEFQQEFKANPQLRLRLKRSYIQFLHFIGIDITSNGALSISDKGRFYFRVQRRNHNLQRITRVIRSLYLLGLQDYALDLHAFLMQFKDQINQVTLDYWNMAITPRGFK